MNKNRYLLYLLLCGLMLYYALPRISIGIHGPEGLFASAWLLFALFVIAGNLSAFLYTPKKQKLAGARGERIPKKSQGTSV
ncbi:hypothetical protein J7E71_00700 [Mesobacillus foraminis]|uniref:hypothetical protein n=1 Tax=Mesobacillus foraminis TaxID=279826 RepID=UPI001BE63806|nr:hypothetical protein [Mesobacillus foraminis]MBT2754460.1 hypothetical protein [Mesobacillus foraminis]